MSAHSDNGSFTGPYRGLEPFDESAAAFFFGRERETRLIEASLFAAPLTLLYGASGVGKSSVLRAGVLPRLRQRRDVLPVVFPRFSSEDQGSIRLERGWQTDPVSGIKETLALSLFASADDQERLRHYQHVVMLHDMAPLRECFDVISKTAERRIMVILDQFEEYSLYHPEDELFAQQFPQAIMPGARSVSFLISLREDALAKLDRFKGRIPTLWDSYRRIDHLDRTAAEDAIRLPLVEYNRRQSSEESPVKIEPALVEVILRDVQTENVQFEEAGTGTLTTETTGTVRIETPYLQLVMTRLWEREQKEKSRTLRLATLESEGGAAEIVRSHLDRVMNQFTTEEQDMAAKIFHRLVTPSGTKIAFSVHDLAEYEAIDPNQLAPILRRLEEGSRRILRRVALRSDASDDPRYEIFHDRLGKAILAWRSKRLKEVARDLSQRQEAERKRMAESERASFRESVRIAMNYLDEKEKAVWARMMFFLVSSAGVRRVQTASDLATFSEQPQKAVDGVLKRLLEWNLLRLGYSSTGPITGSEPRYEIAHDALAAAFLEWHSSYVEHQTHSTLQLQKADAPKTSAIPPELASFPYGIVGELLRKQRVVPFLGAGVALSARRQDLPSSEQVASFPSNHELKTILAQECEFPATEFEASDIAEIASYYVHLAGREALDKLLEREMGRNGYVPSETHRFFADIAQSTPLTILTTNFDTLMEQALDERGLAYNLAGYLPGEAGRKGRLAYLAAGDSTPREVSGLDVEDAHERTIVVRLHGRTVRNEKQFGSYVLTEEDQIDWLLNLQRSEGLSPILSRTLRLGHLLSLGQSARDWSQRALMRTISQLKRTKAPAWAVALRPSPMSIMTWQRYDVSVFNLDLNDWVAQMREAGSL